MLGGLELHVVIGKLLLAIFLQCAEVISRVASEIATEKSP